MTRGATVKKKTGDLPGMEDLGVQEIEDAAASLLEVEGRKKAVRTEYDNQETVLINVMKKNEKDFYSHDGLEVSLNQGKTHAKVKHKEVAEAA